MNEIEEKLIELSELFELFEHKSEQVKILDNLLSSSMILIEKYEKQLEKIYEEINLLNLVHFCNTGRFYL